MNLLMLGVLLFFGAALLALSAVEGYLVERHQVYRSLRSVRTIQLAPADLRRRELSRPFADRVALPALRWLGRIGRRLSPASVPERIGKELAYAGSPAGWDAERVLALKIMAGAFLAPAVFGLTSFAGSPPARRMALSLLFGLAGFYLPDWMLRARAGKRQGVIRRNLPDALDLLSITVEAGLGFDGAMAKVAREMGGPLGEELHRVLQEMQIGRPRPDALRDLAERTAVPELKSFVLAMVQADVFGVSVTKVLHVQARELRIKRRQRAEEQAQKIPVKIIFPVLLCIFPALFVVLLGPPAITVYQNLILR